jgi:aspartate/methionine/tyrosine aminotransferase
VWEPAESTKNLELKNKIRETAKKANSTTIRFDIGEPDFCPPDYVTDAMVSCHKGGKSKYRPAGGLQRLRELIADYQSESLERRISAEQVVMTPGASGAIYIVLSTFVNPGDSVMYPDPGFPNYREAIKKVGAIPVPYNIKEKLPEFDMFSIIPLDLKENIKKHKPKVAIFNSPGNPGGNVECEAMLKDAIEICDENGVNAFSDEVYDKFIYGVNYTPVGTLTDKAIIANSFSKSLGMTGDRLGYVVVPDEKTAEIISRVENVVIACPPTPPQYGAIAAFKNQDKTNAFINDKVNEFRKRKDLMVQNLRSIKGIRCDNPDGAFYIFPNVEELGMSSQQLSDFLFKEANITAVPGDAFGENGEGHLRFAYTTSKIEEGMERMKTALDSLS